MRTFYEYIDSINSGILDKLAKDHKKELEEVFKQAILSDKYSSDFTRDLKIACQELTEIKPTTQPHREPDVVSMSIGGSGSDPNI